MNVGHITPGMLDAAIRWQMATPQDSREKLTLAATNSRQFVDYFDFCMKAIVEGQDVRAIICTALTIGIEIGMALEEMQRRPQA